MSRRYSSFKEIDKDLRVLKLKKEIDMVCLENDFSRFKNYFTISSLSKELIKLVGISLLSSKGGIVRVGIGFLLKKLLLR